MRNDDARAGKLYQEVCALLVAAEKRIRFACNSIPMPPARYMLSFNMRQEKCWTRIVFGHAQVSILSFSPV